MGLLDSALKFAAPVAGIVAPLIAADKGVGKNTTNVTDFGRTTQYDPNATRYGRTAGAADATANRFAGLAANAQNRGAAQANYDQANWIGQNQATQARIGQNNIADAMGRRALGQVPSIAEMQANRQMQQAAAAQASAGAGARGAAGLALAGQNAAANTANAQSDISGQAQINAANERMMAEQGAVNAYTGIRSGDQNAMNTAAQMAQYNAALQQQARGQNDAYANMLYGQEQDVRRQDLTGGMNNQSILGNTFTNAQGQRIGVGAYNADREMDYYRQLMGGIQGSADAGTAMNLAGKGGGGGPIPTAAVNGTNTNMVGIPMPGKARGGPVSERRPYLVGEQGPELIVPRDDGYVLTAPQTRDAVARAYGGPVQGYPARADGGPVQGGGEKPRMTNAEAARLMGEADTYHTRMRRMMEEGPAARRLASGTPENDYTTELVPAAERAYERHRQATSPWDTGGDYDLRGAYAAGLDRDPRGHLPDTYKKPNHPTFSDESQYARYGNPGHWGPGVENFIPAPARRAMGGPVSAGGMSPLEALLGGGSYGGVGASSGPAPASYDVLNPDGSMNVQGSLQAHSDAATRYGRDPTGGMQGGGLMGGGY